MEIKNRFTDTDLMVDDLTKRLETLAEELHTNAWEEDIDFLKKRIGNLQLLINDKVECDLFDIEVDNLRKMIV